MGTEAIDIKGAPALEFGMALDIKGCLLCAVSAVGQGVDGAVLDRDIYALTILHMDGRAAEGGALVG